jgi:D-arabinose 1-dehydrogenase-like Zn-dependent alcohol dehydrogenase
MRAVVFSAAGELRVEDRPEPVPGFKEVLIETAAVGICGTDTHVLDGEFEGTIFPLVPGHEATGTVVAIGDGVADGANPWATTWRSTRVRRAVNASSV